MSNWDAGSVSEGSLAAGDFSTADAVNHKTGEPSPESHTHERQRRWPRFAVDMPVHVRVTTQGPTRVVACQGKGTDLSCGGLAVTADIDLPVGAQIGVEFIPPYSNQTIMFRCFVRNRDGFRYGVEFITENNDDYRKAGELQQCLATMKTTTK